MSEAQPQTRWTWDDYLEWEADQPIRYELVDGQVYAMGGGTAEHDTISNNLRAALHTQMRGTPYLGRDRMAGRAAYRRDPRG